LCSIVLLISVNFDNILKGLGLTVVLDACSDIGVVFDAVGHILNQADFVFKTFKALHHILKNQIAFDIPFRPNYESATRASKPSFSFIMFRGPH